MMWHALVASTAGTGIRLKLTSDETFPHMHVLSLPSWPELGQRLTALVISVEHADDVAAVCSLTALRHLQMETHEDSAATWPPDASADSRMGGCQLTQLRTLWMAGVAPAAFFLPGTAACLPLLHSVAVSECRVPDGELPPDMLRLPVAQTAPALAIAAAHDARLAGAASPAGACHQRVHHHTGACRRDCTLATSKGAGFGFCDVCRGGFLGCYAAAASEWPLQGGVCIEVCRCRWNVS